MSAIENLTSRPPTISVDGVTPSDKIKNHRIIFLNPRRATSKRIGNYDIPEGYRNTSEFFHCGLIDRTLTLDHGFPYTVLDSIPEPKKSDATFTELCDTIGGEIITRAIANDRKIRVLWSGGIDSTSALISLMKASQAINKPDILEVFYSDAMKKRMAAIDPVLVSTTWPQFNP